MPPPEYRFESRWTVPVPGDDVDGAGICEVYDAVYDVLADLAAYPDWWPQVRSVEAIDADSARVVCRSFLPYTLRFEMLRVRDDRSAGVLEARLRGDLDGWARWTVSPHDDEAALLYEQEVRTPGRLLRSLARTGRPLLVLNHAWMMRGARHGLQRRLRMPVAVG